MTIFGGFVEEYFKKNLEISDEVAKWLLDIKAVNFRPDDPYMFTAGWASPVYIDCRWIISFLQARRRLIDLSVKMLNERNILASTDMIAGGETAGIPYAAWISEETSLPMLYVRKNPKGFGKNAQIEGCLSHKSKVLLVEDLATDGGSKVNFVKALQVAGASVNDVFVIFFYDIFPGALETLRKNGITLHYLCTWHDVLRVAKSERYFEKSIIVSVENFLSDPVAWSGTNGGRSS